MPDVDLDARLDELFGTEPGDFVKVRDALVRDLKAADRTDDADAVKSLKRPTLALAAVNQTARHEPARVRALVEIGEQLAALQARTSPDRDELRDLTRERRTLLHQLTEAAAATTARPEGVRSAIAATFDAASLDDELRDALQRGRLTQELTPATRFVADDGAPSHRAAPRRTKREPPPPRDELAARRARTELAAVRERAEAAEESAREHAEAAADATEALAAAQRHVAELEAALADARAAVADAKRQERDALRAETRARAEQERVAAALRAAERAVDGSV
jgi:hypothetical protein